MRRGCPSHVVDTQCRLACWRGDSRAGARVGLWPLWHRSYQVLTRPDDVDATAMLLERRGCGIHASSSGGRCISPVTAAFPKPGSTDGRRRARASGPRSTSAKWHCVDTAWIWHPRLIACYGRFRSDWCPFSRRRRGNNGVGELAGAYRDLAGAYRELAGTHRELAGAHRDDDGTLWRRHA